MRQEEQIVFLRASHSPPAEYTAEPGQTRGVDVPALRLCRGAIGLATAARALLPNPSGLHQNSIKDIVGVVTEYTAQWAAADVSPVRPGGDDGRQPGEAHTAGPHQPSCGTAVHAQQARYRHEAFQVVGSYVSMCLG